MTDTDHRSPSEDVGATNKSILAQDKNTPKGAAAEDHSASESTGALYNIGATQQILPPKVGFLAFPLKFGKSSIGMPSLSSNRNAIPK